MSRIERMAKQDRPQCVGKGVFTVKRRGPMGWSERQVARSWQASRLGVALGCLLWMHLAARLPGQQFEALKLDGTSLSVERWSIRGAEVDLVTPMGAKTLAMSELQAIRRKPMEKPKAGPMVLGMLDGSELVVEGIGGAGDRWQVMTSLGAMVIPKGAAHWLLLRKPSEQETEGWKGQLEQSRETDVLIIARENQVLDRAGGEIVAIEPTFIQFDFDGQRIEAPREKLLGVLWYRKPLDRVLPTVRIRTRDGSLWNGLQLQMEEGNPGKLTWKTALEVGAEAELTEIQEVDFSAANLKWLADLEPMEAKVEPRLTGEGVVSGREVLFQPRFGDGTGVEESQDLYFTSSSQIVFRNPSGFQKFEATVQRASPGDARSPIEIQVWENDQALWKGSLSPDQESLPIQLTIQPERRLRLQVTSGSLLRAGMQVVWKQPRYLR